MSPIEADLEETRKLLVQAREDLAREISDLREGIAIVLDNLNERVAELEVLVVGRRRRG